MFEYKKAIKSVEKIEKLIEIIRHSKESSGYRVQISYGNGDLYENVEKDYYTEIFVTDNYRNTKGFRIDDVYSNEEEVKLPCSIYGDPIQSNGVIKKVEFNKDKIIDELKKNEKYITNTETATIEVPQDDNIIVMTNLLTKYTKVYFEEYNTTKEWLNNNLMVKNDIIDEFEMNPSYFDVSVNRGKLSPYLKKGRTNMYLRKDVLDFVRNLTDKN